MHRFDLHRRQSLFWYGGRSPLKSLKTPRQYGPIRPKALDHKSGVALKTHRRGFADRPKTGAAQISQPPPPHPSPTPHPRRAHPPPPQQTPPPPHKPPRHLHQWDAHAQIEVGWAGAPLGWTRSSRARPVCGRKARTSGARPANILLLIANSKEMAKRPDVVGDSCEPIASPGMGRCEPRGIAPMRNGPAPFRRDRQARARRFLPRRRSIQTDFRPSRRHGGTRGGRSRHSGDAHQKRSTKLDPDTERKESIMADDSYLLRVGGGYRPGGVPSPTA